jgi:type I restriction-modification system DNA methylase subunit
MNQVQARELIKATFTRAFDKTRFRTFTVNLLNHVNEEKAFDRNRQYIKDAFKDHVNRFERLGEYVAPDGQRLDVLIVHLTTESKLERARTAIRNFVADHLKERHDKEAALVAFVSPSEKQWRFSYVKMEYATVKKESGRVGVETLLTPARRFSYIVGEGESCQTAQSRFLSLLQDTETDPALAAIEEAFSVEAVTKEFFTKYAELFGDINAALERLVARDKTIRDEFQEKHVNTVDFAKKLMGQIVFLYFLQKKGWLGVAKGQDWGTGPHNFLRQLADAGNYDNFFNDVLEPLFYDTLATDRGHEAWCDRFKCRIPFLNGGLFEPLGDYDWKNTDIILPNKLFTNSDYVDEGVAGTGVLDVFDRYNFTVNEAEPLEKEVAIDPEMLGKVFENLIEENRRKGLGSYYTPREIVHYMCQESLINYLDTALNTRTEPIGREKRKQASFGDAKEEQTLLAGKARDEIVPRADIETFVHTSDQAALYEAARVSGTKSYRRELPKSIEKNARLIDEKLADITVCDPAVGSGAFPVGMMTEIVRARCALTPYFNDVHERTPYHFKHDAIQNCLYGVDIDPGAVEIAKLRLWLSLVVDEDETKQIKPLPNLFYRIVFGNSLRGVEKTLFNEKLFRQLEGLKPRYFHEHDKRKKDEYKRQIEATIHELTSGKEAFDFEIYFSEVFHQKLGFDVVIGNPPWGQKAISLDAAEKSYVQQAFPSSAGIFDMFRPFVERGIRLLKARGAFAMILPDIVLLKDYQETRRFILEQLTLAAIDWWGMAFDSAVIDTATIIGTRTRCANQHPVRVAVRDPETPLLHEIPQGDFWSNPRYVFNLFLTPEKRQILERLAHCPRLGEFFEIHEGVHSGNIRAELFIDDKADKTCRQLLFGGDEIAPYRLVWNGKYIRLGAVPERKSKERYANVGRPEWYDCDKILVRRTGDYVLAAKDSDRRYASNNFFVVFPKRASSLNLDGLCALLNSRFMTWFFRTIEPRRGRVFAELKIKHLESFPLPSQVVDRGGCKEINDLGAKRAALAHNLPEVSLVREGNGVYEKLDAAIDSLVAKMFGIADLRALIEERKVDYAETSKT